MLESLKNRLHKSKKELKKVSHDSHIVGLEDITSVEEFSVITKDSSALLKPDAIDARLASKGQLTGIFPMLSKWVSKLAERYRGGVIAGISIFVIVWIALNIPGISLWFIDKGWTGWHLHLLEFDPFPYKGLSMVFSFLGAILSNLVLISQKKAEERERVKTELSLELAQKQGLDIELLLEQVKEHRNDLDELVRIQHNTVTSIEELMTKLESIEAKIDKNL